MLTPPSLIDIEAALVDLRQPMERKLIEIQELRDRYVEAHRKSAAVVDPVYVERSKKLRQSVREQQRRMDRWPQTAVRTLVLCDPVTEEIQAVALMPDDPEIGAIDVGSWTVMCRRCSFHLLRCQVGDMTPQGLVVSVNGSPLIDEFARQKILDAHRAPPVPPREQKRRDQLGRKLRLERFLFERRIREQVWQEQLFQRRRAIEEREQILQDRLRREQIEKEEERRKALDEWDRERNQWMVGHHDLTGAESAPEVADSSVPTDSHEQEHRERIDTGIDEEEIEAIRTSIDRMPAPADLGFVLAAFGGGCVVGLFVAPTAFSLFGAVAAGVAAVSLRLALRDRRKD